MPVYEYRCTECDVTWDVVAPMFEKAAIRFKTCPKCGKTEFTKQVYSKVAIKYGPTWTRTRKSE